MCVCVCVCVCECVQYTCMYDMVSGLFRKISKGGQKHIRRHFWEGGGAYSEQYSILKG